MSYKMFNRDGELIGTSNVFLLVKQDVKEHWREAEWAEDENGNVVAGRKPEPPASWSAVLPMMLAVLRDGDEKGKALAMEGLKLMAATADSAGRKPEPDGN